MIESVRHQPSAPRPRIHSARLQVRATVELLEAPPSALTARVYNVTAASFTPAEVTEAIAARLPGFKSTYAPDFRQAIADSWPASVDDSLARHDWGWRHAYGLPEMADDMLAALSARLGRPADLKLK